MTRQKKSDTKMEIVLSSESDEMQTERFREVRARLRSMLDDFFDQHLAAVEARDEQEAQDELRQLSAQVNEAKDAVGSVESRRLRRTRAFQAVFLRTRPEDQDEDE